MPASIVINVEQGGTGVWAEYEMSQAPAFALKKLQLLTDKWGFDFTNSNDPTPTVPAYACHAARLLAERWGVPHP